MRRMSPLLAAVLIPKVAVAAESPIFEEDRTGIGIPSAWDLGSANHD